MNYFEKLIQNNTVASYHLSAPSKDISQKPYTKSFGDGIKKAMEEQQKKKGKKKNEEIQDEDVPAEIGNRILNYLREKKGWI